MRKRPRTWIGTTALVGLLALAALAGCMGGGSENKAGDNKAPSAQLEVDDNTRWTGESFSFDPRKSDDPDGEIVRYKLDFGDKTVLEYDARSTDRDIEHMYLNGGEYTVVLTVTDDGADNAGALTSTDSVKVAVNQRKTFEGTVLYAGEGTQPAMQSIEIPVAKGGDRIESQITITSTLLVGSSQFKVELKNPDNTTLDTRTMNVNQGSNATETLKGSVTEEGVYRLVVTAQSGGGAIKGENRIYYDVGFTG